MAMPTTGALLINPRRRKRKTTRKKKTSSAARSRAARLGWARRRRNGTKKGGARKTARRAYSRKRNTRKAGVRKTARRAYMRRRNTRKGGVRKTARRAYMRRRNTRKGGVRKTARRAYSRRRNTRKGGVRTTARRAYSRKRNPNMLNAISQPLKRIPVIGPIASDAVQLGIPAAFGAISIEPVMFGLKYAGNYLPKGLQKVSFTIGGMVMGALVKRFMPGSAEVRKQFAVALATAGGAVDYYRWKTGQGTVQAMTAAEKAGWGELEMEAMDGLGELELAMDGYGALYQDDDDDDMDGFGELELAVDGFGDYDDDDDDDDMDGWGDLDGYGDMDGYGDFGELEIAQGVGNFSNPGTQLMGFGDASAADAMVSGDDMEEIEADAILAGPDVFHGAAFGAPMRVSPRKRVVSVRRMVVPRLSSTSSSFVRPRLPGAQRPTAQPYYQASQTPSVSQYGGKRFGRWFWLVKLYGYQRAMQVAKLPQQQRKAYISQLRRTAIANHPGLYAAITGQMTGAPAF
jgi:hypothetical protein